MTEAPALQTKNPADRIALRGVRVRSRLAGMSLRTVVEQTFVNAEDRPIEAVYTFPLSDSAAVCGFEIVTGDRTLKGEIEEREKATERYMNAKDDGHGAYLLERHRPDVFTVNVGNLKPRQAARVSITYVAEVTVTDNVARLSFPTTIAPRYATTTATDPTDAMLDADALNPPHVLDVPFGLTLELDVDLGRALKSIASPTHAVKTEFPADGGHRYRVTFAAASKAMNRDVVLALEFPGEQAPCAQLADGPDEAKYLAVTFVPELGEAALERRPPAEVVFVVDCSGSMEGSSIEQARVALELCLRSMCLGDRFNICRFGSTFELLHPEPIAYTEEALRAATARVRTMDADLGGTELHAPLRAVLSTPAAAGTVRQVILLTDGQVTNEPAILALAREHRAHNRVFSFGIGAASSAFLVSGVARATGGAAEFIARGEDIAEKVLRTFSRIASPAVTDVAIDWGGAEATAAPAEVPPVFDGDALTVFARVAGKPPERVTLSARFGNGRSGRWTTAFRPATDPDAAIATAWARRMIDDLEPNGRAAPEHRERLLRVSKTFNVLCSATAFVAVEHRADAERTDGAAELRRIPVMLAEGWGEIDDDIPCVCCAAAPAPRPRRPAIVDATPASGRSFARPAATSFEKRQSRQVGFPSTPPAYAARPEPALAPASPDGLPLFPILTLQDARGAFSEGDAIHELTEDLGHLIGECRTAVRALFGRTWRRGPSEVERTVIVLLALRLKFDDQPSLWQPAYDKAVRYLADVSKKSVNEIRDWLDATASGRTPIA